jgi:hypothetical protein
LAEQAPAAPTLDERLRMLVEPGALPDPSGAPVVAPAPHPLPIDGGLLEAPGGRLAQLKQHISSLFHRAGTSDLATGVQMAATSGSGRIATAAAILGVCLSSAGVATVCVVTGAVTDPLGLLWDDHPRVVAKPHVTHRRPSRHTPSHTLARAAATPAPTPVATATPQPRTTAQRRKVAPAATPPPLSPADPSQGTTPTSHENAPISPAPASAAGGTESFSPEVPQTPAAPAPAPATGGEEFGP